MRERPEVTRDGVTHRVTILAPDDTGRIEEVTLYITANCYPDGRPCEIFLRTGREGSTVDGLLDCLATLTSVALQSGVELKLLVDKFSHSKFEPAGWTKGETPIKQAKSLVDYIFRWLEIAFLDKSVGLESLQPYSETQKQDGETFVNELDAPPCAVCGSVMVRHGTCYTCHNCGSTSGCG